MDLEDIERVRSDLRFRGAQGTTGTQASFMEIFHNDTSKIDKLNEILCAKAGFPSCYTISTQTVRISLFQFFLPRTIVELCRRFKWNALNDS